MDQPHETEAITALRRFEIDGTAYHLKPLLWKQCKWLGEHIFVGMDLTAIDFAMVHDVGRARGPLFMAICLVRDDETQKIHVKKTWDEILARATDFEGAVTGEEVGEFCQRFFMINPPRTLVMLLTGRQLRQAWENVNLSAPSPTASGSSAASSPLATETLPASSASSLNGDPLIQIRSSDDALSDGPSTAPSWTGAVLSSPG